MNEHHENEDTLTAYLDGELDAVAMRRVDAHLAGCAACRATLAAWREADAALAAVVPARSEAEWDALAQRVDRAIVDEEAREARILDAASHTPESKPRGGRRFLWVWSSGAVAAAVLVLLVRPWIDEPPPSTTRPTSESGLEKERAALELPRATTPSDAVRQDAAPDAGAQSGVTDDVKSKAKDSVASPAPAAENVAPIAPPPAGSVGGAGVAREESEAKITPEPSGALLMRSDADASQPSTKSMAGDESMQSPEKRAFKIYDKPQAAEGMLQESPVTPPTEADLEKSLAEVDAALRDPSSLLKVPELHRRRMLIAAQLAAFNRERWCETALAARADWLRDGATDSTSVREAAWIEERCGER